MNSYNPQEIEKKWQKYWEDNNTFKTPEDVTPENKYYILPQLPYPSGSGLHVGHAEVYTACDIFARFQRMNGKKVLQVIGWDSFGLPAENYAIKTNVHPKKSTDDAVNNFRSQIKALGISVDWDREVGSHNSDYYKWTQWFFLLMYNRGLAYRKMQSVNWCDSCKTVLANDQVKEGKCERCDTTIIQKEMEQWYIKITDYAERLLQDIEKLDWPEETKKRQADWIGRSEGAEILFRITCDTDTRMDADVADNADLSVTVFTTRPDTLFGATYMVLAPDHGMVHELKDKIENWDEVEKYILETSKKTDLDRQVEKEKTGVELKGIKAINPATNEEIPVWIADFVLATYGSGAIFADAHDERDFEFAKKYNIPLKVTIEPDDIELADHVKKLEVCYVGDGVHFNSEFLNGLRNKDAIIKIIFWLEEKGFGKRKVQYKLRDWSVSRQRFWGAPIPMLRNEQRATSKKQYVFIQGRASTVEDLFWPWLKTELENRGNTVVALNLKPSEPKADEQAKFLLNNVEFDENTVVIGHSHGGTIAFRILEQLKKPIAKLVLVDPVLRPEFNDKVRMDVEQSTNWKFDFQTIRKNSQETVVIADEQHIVIPKDQIEELRDIFECRVVYTKALERHFQAKQVMVLLSLSRPTQ
ncbi:MAG: leucine--tRNA ligase [Candidatus Magasanikbacteria bacterium]|nr:leucine--tRNA ligase [Candidatus Magasanikbacteria bacterium]